ncbi:MAG: hypothetical protein ABIH26_09710 [Candidatus Eisenbacteria bacterium]
MPNTRRRASRSALTPARPLVLLAVLILFARSESDGADFRYRCLETENLKLVYYDEEHSYVVPHLTRCFENSLRYHRDLFRYRPSEEVTVQLQDFDDHGYAGTTTIPYNFISVGIEPFEYVYDTCPTNERMNWVMSHELVHVVACDQAAPWDRFFRTLFSGKVMPTDEDPVSMFYSYLTNPRFYAPRWYHEGIAVFLETWMAGGIGRAQSGYDEMVFRTMVRDSSFFYDIVGLESEGTTSDFQIGQNSYLYGTRFVSYLAYLHGPEKMLEWFRRARGTERYFASQFRRVYDVSLDDEWSRWIEWEHEWQRANLDSIRRYPVTPSVPLSERPLGSVSRAFYDRETRKLYVAVRYPGEFAHIAEIDIDSGKMRKICEIDLPALYYVAFVAYDPSSSRLFFTTNNGKYWRGISAVDVNSGKTETLIRYVRTGDLAFNRADGSLWGVQHHRGLSRLVRIPPPYTSWHELLVLPYGRDMFDLDVSPDGKHLSASVVEISGEQRLVLMETEKLLRFDATYETLWEPEHIAPSNFVFSPDGRFLYGTSYLTGVSNVFRYDLAERKMEVLSNSETGFFRPVPIADDSLIVFSYGGEGFVPSLIRVEPTEDVAAVRYLGHAVVEKHPQVAGWILGSPAAVDIDSVTVRSGDYSGIRNLGFASLYPIAEGYKQYPAFGLRADILDPAWVHRLTLAASYTPEEGLPEDERAHARFSYRRYPWTLTGSYNAADFYDFFGPTKSSRKGYSLGLGYRGYLYLRGTRSLQYGLSAGGYWGLERLPDYQNVATSFDNFATAGATLSWSDLAGTIGSVEAEKGFLWSLNSSNTRVRSKTYPRLHGDLALGFLLPLDHSSIWLHAAGGHGFGGRDEPFANFYFGGFGNNWVDHANVNRYRKHDSFPGKELNAVGGRNFSKAMVEWTLPPLRFRRLGFTFLYSNWARLAFFSSGIATNLDSREARRELVDAGVQLNLKLVIFSSLESTFSVGYARAAEKGAGPEDELMASLKILR